MTRPCSCNRVTSATYDLSQCRVCWLIAHDERYQRLFSGESTGRQSVTLPPPQRRADCQHLGKVLDRGNCNCPQKWVRVCERHGSCRLGPSADGVPSCQGCADYVSDDEEPPAAGVVIGSYNYPKLIALQVRLIREHNGPRTPILIVDDCSPGTARTPQPASVFAELCALMRSQEGVTVWSNPERYGHAGGDLASYFVGLQWAKAHRLRVLCKLSQRCLLDIPDWLHLAAEGLLDSGLATGCHPCREGSTTFPLRTEAILFDVDRWHRPDVLDHLRPRPVTGYPAELIVWDDMTDRIGVEMWPWPIMGDDRMTRYPGVVWHCSHRREDYEAIAERYGLPLDDHFTCSGWQAQEGYKW